MMALSGSLAARVLTSLGIGFISYESLNALVDNLKQQVLQNYHGLPADMMGLLGLSGIEESIQITLAAFVTRAGLMAIKRLGVLPQQS